MPVLRQASEIVSDVAKLAPVSSGVQGVKIRKIKFFEKFLQPCNKLKYRILQSDKFSGL